MQLEIAIQPDIHYRGQKPGSFSDRWIERAQGAGVGVRVVDVWAPDIIDQIRGADGFMWRYMNRLRERRLGQILCPAVEIGLGIPVFPSWRTGRHYEDKVAQKYALEAAGLPIPDTWIFFDPEQALAFCRTARYPLVMKLATGFMSRSVIRIDGRDEAEHWVRRMFANGVTRLRRSRRDVTGAVRDFVELSPWAGMLRGETRLAKTGLQHGYVLFQEFLPDNAFDTRITVVGNRAWGFRRFNRPNDWRSSGSGLVDHDVSAIDEAAVRLGFKVAQRLGTQALTTDCLRRAGELVLGEVSYSFHGFLVHRCPGHWVLEGDAEAGSLRWVEGRMHAEDAIFDDLVALIRASRRAGAPPSATI